MEHISNKLQSIQVLFSGPANEANLLLLTGGWDGNSELSSTEVFPPTANCSPPSLPGKRYYHTTFLTAGDDPVVATCGGQDDRNILSSCLVLNASTGQWEENRIGSLLQERDSHAAVTLDQFVFVIGGQGLSARSTTGSTTELLRAGSSSWEQGPTLPIEMGNGPCAVAISGTSFLAIHLREIREFDTSVAGPTSSQGWREKGWWPKMETSRFAWPGCAKLGDKIIIAGGWGRSTRPTLQTTEILDLTSRTISKGGNLVTPRSYFQMITIDNNGDSTTLALGGVDGDDNTLKSIEKWKPETETWSEVEDQLEEERSLFGLVAAPKNLVCLSK